MPDAGKYGGGLLNVQFAAPNIDAFIDGYKRWMWQERQQVFKNLIDEVSATALDRVKAGTPLRTGALRRGWRRNKGMTTEAVQEMLISNNRDYLNILMEGSGIYGERRRPIVPVRRKALMWRDVGTPSQVRKTGQKYSGAKHFAFRVRGVKPQNILQYLNEGELTSLAESMVDAWIRRYGNLKEYSRQTD